MNRMKLDLFNENLWQYLLLVNMAIPLYFMLQEPAPRLAPGVAALIGVVVLQVLAAKLKKYAAIWAALQLTVILTLGLLYNPMYVYLVFLMTYTFIALKLPSLLYVTSYFAAGVIVIIISSGHIGEIQFWINILPPIFGGCVMPYVIRVSVRYREMAERLQAATKQIERFAQQEERHRIANELHDTLGHTLSLIALKSELAEKLALRAPERAASEAREIRTAASAALKQMRELVSDMKIVRLSEEWEHARTLCAAANVQLIVEDRTAPYKLTPLQESVLAMCVREALTNMVRYSRATACKIELHTNDEAIRCIVSDNGIGIGGDPLAAAGNGILSMKHRLGLLEGQLSYETNAGKGTRLNMDIPIVRRKL
ncbi:sensor histidine kinase [Paenibacillus contaminans]|uniref:histidine kinase n=1 Tax=Paenibacillus contaminans TaxID=450362 RepID=A0A329LL12_9BACL|nr:sensor histidine kinase [Paenibacillus contaminans]RAV08654.1 sensor histidine kinase [Paenibacillus contaminans]